jgi:hypothetical protein
MGVIYMREELKVGDIIIYYGGALEFGRKQIIFKINDVHSWLELSVNFYRYSLIDPCFF